VLTLHDPDGLELELVPNRAAKDKTLYVWKEGPIPIEHAIRGFHSVTLSEVGYEYTAHVFTDELGFKLMGQDEIINLKGDKPSNSNRARETPLSIF
jgi:glyoxalase family protein